MAPRTAEQFHDIRKKKRQLIMDAALKVISEKGYHTASIALIAQESGVSKGLMYNYFKSKEDLLIAIMVDGFSKVFDQYTIDNRLSPEENVMLLVEQTFDVLDNMQETLMVYFSVLMNNEVFTLVKDKLNEMAEPIMEGFTHIMASLGYENPIAEACFLRFVLDGISLNYLLIPEEFPKEYCVNRIKQIYIAQK